jgi:cell wall-associated NlpC family hydrolase
MQTKKGPNMGLETGLGRTRIRMLVVGLGLSAIVLALSFLTVAIPPASARTRTAHLSRQNGPGPALINAAVRWAQQQIGQVYTGANPYAGWWSGYCEAFAEGAYRRHFHYWSAATDYRTERLLGRIHRGIPPRGALVFYNDGSYGHVALSTGGGWVISAIGSDVERLPVVHVRYRWFYAAYLGWAMPLVKAPGIRLATAARTRPKA